MATETLIARLVPAGELTGLFLALAEDGFIHTGGFGLDFDREGGHSGATYRHPDGTTITAEYLYPRCEAGAKGDETPLVSVFWGEGEPMSPLMRRVFEPVSRTRQS